MLEWLCNCTTRLACLFILGISLPVAAQPEQFPSKRIRIIFPFAPGGGGDLLARALAQKLSGIFGQPVIVDNRPGASGVIGTDIVAKAAPDGYTLVMISSTHSIAPSLLRSLPYDSVKDFAPVILITGQPYLLGVHPSVLANSVKELVALARSKPGQLNYASGGVGTAPHLAGELFNFLSGTNIVHVPYQGGNLAVTALMSGEVAMLFSSLPNTLPQVNAGKVRAIAVSSANRSSAAPALPTVAESGVLGFEVVNWNGLLAPAETPSSIIGKLNDQIARVVRTPEFKERLAANGIDVVASSPAEFMDYLKVDIARWAKVVKAANIRVE